MDAAGYSLYGESQDIVAVVAEKQGDTSKNFLVSGGL